jgi:hypothetical protein
MPRSAAPQPWASRTVVTGDLPLDDQATSRSSSDQLLFSVIIAFGVVLRAARITLTERGRG